MSTDALEQAEQTFFELVNHTRDIVKAIKALAQGAKGKNEKQSI